MDWQNKEDVKKYHREFKQRYRAARKNDPEYRRKMQTSAAKYYQMHKEAIKTRIRLARIPVELIAAADKIL